MLHEEQARAKTVAVLLAVSLRSRGRSAGSGPAPGVLPGFQLMALNGRDIKHLWVETPGDQMLQLLPSEVKV